MALRVAVANGNWSNPSTWYLGVKPTAADIAASNGFTITIDENVTVGSITNTAQNPISIIPLMTSATTPSGTVTASSQEPAVYNAWKAFDGSTVQAGSWNNNRTNPGTEWIEYQFPTAKTVTGYWIQTYSGGPTAWQFQAWNGSSWVVLDSVTGGTSVMSRSFTNTTAYTRYRLAITAPLSSFYLSELRMFEIPEDGASAVAGGGFVLSNGVTLTCTTELRSGNATLLLWSGGTGTSASVVSPTLVGAGSGRAIDYAGVGTLNVNIPNITGVGAVAPTLVHVGAAGTINIVGSFNHFADLRGTMLNIAAAATVNVTGNIVHDKYTNAVHAAVTILTSGSTLNITGDVVTGMIDPYWGVSWNLNSTYTINITGTVSAIAGNSSVGITTAQAGFFRIIGPIITYGNLPAFRSTNSSAINLFSGPFVCSTYGFVPFQCIRMHLIPTTNSYFEFRDETTNGAVAPSATAPATQLVSPATVGDNPIPANVRFGTLYSLGTLTGTLRMPTANQVTFGVPVDNTFGNAVLTAASVWDYLVANITVADSIGMRLKNVATPQTVGSQLASLL
jgi:hypothetical protein